MTIKLVDSEKELLQILEIQKSNHYDNIPLETQNSNGFVTVKHNLELINKMNSKAKQIIATENNVVVGYALVMLKEFKNFIPALVPMFTLFNTVKYKKNTISSYNYYVMGQVCIADSHKGKGVFKKLYAKHKEAYSQEFDFCVTEVSSNNIPSMKAHLKVGFKTVHTYKHINDEWNILIWNWE